MKNSIRWLLTESKISGLDPQKVNYINGKLICYHLTSHQNWANYNPSIEDKMKNPLIKHPKQEISSDDSRAARILKNLKPKYFNEKYLIKDTNGIILKKSENLNQLIDKTSWNKLRLVK